MSGFIQPRHGSSESLQSTDGVDKHEVLWTAGEHFGKLRYQASPNYRWAFDVAIVDVTLDVHEGSRIEYANLATNPPVQEVRIVDGVPRRQARVDSTTGRSGAFANTPASTPIPPPFSDRNEPAMKAYVTVSSIVGPTRGGKMYGVNKIEVGLGQTASFTAFNAIYGAGPATTPILSSAGSLDPTLRGITLQGTTFIDAITTKWQPGWTYNDRKTTNAARNLPYYDKEGYTSWVGTGEERRSIFETKE
jgi:hypothetical protein